jgi:hypothetical protein
MIRIMQLAKIKPVGAVLVALGLYVFGTGLLSAPGQPARPPASEHSPADVARLIDHAIDRALSEAKVKASPPASDGEFLRRVTIDLIGRIPTAERAAAFLADQRPDKRVRLVDELLASPEYGRNFATIWFNRIGPRSGFSEGGNRIEYSLFPWLADQFNRNRPWGEMVADMLCAEGDINKNPATGFYIAEANTTDGVVHAERVTGMASQLFLGINLRCAQCHNHPFARWKQTDFWGLTAFFGRVGYTTKPTFFKVLTESKDIRNKDDQPIPTARPDATALVPGKNTEVRARLLDGTEPKLDLNQPFRKVLSAWMTSRDNKLFARAAVNRMWTHFFGRGLVNPVDDILNELPTHPELFEQLGDEFIASGHDLKYLARSICLSQVYQRTSRPLPDNKRDEQLYSHMPLRQMRPEPLVDSLMQIVDGRTFDKDFLEPFRNGGRSRLIETLPTDDDPAHYSHGLPQMLTLMNSTLMGYRKKLVVQALDGKMSWERTLEHLYLGVLTRKPDVGEVTLFTRYRDEHKTTPKDQLYAQIVWTLINSSEFLFNH